MKVGIVGAGTMGSAIGQVFATAGNEVVLTDITEDFAAKGKKKIEAALNRRVEKGKLAAEAAAEILAAISTGLKDKCGDCDFILEAAVENMEIKKQTFRELDKICSPECIFATNTSSLPITEVAAGLAHPVIGMHFFNPAATMKLVEVISGLNTPKEVEDKVCQIAEAIGKTPVRAKDNAGFVVNRILTPMLNEAISVLAEGTATAEDIDKAMVLGCNMPMGPLALADLCGLDVVLAVCETLQRETGDPKYRPHPLLRKMVRGGRLGVKSGMGFYAYNH